MLDYKQIIRLTNNNTITSSLTGKRAYFLLLCYYIIRHKVLSFNSRTWKQLHDALILFDANGGM